MGEQKFIQTKSYFEPDEAEVKQLQREAADLHATVDARDTSWVYRTRPTERLKDVERQIQTSRMAKRRAEQVQQPQRRTSAPPGYVVSDCGTPYIRVAQNAEPQLFAEPVRYYA